MSIRHGNEEVWVGDPVDVLNETDNAYFVRYGVGTYPNYTDYKERWISKNAILSANQVNTNPTPSYQPWQTTVKNRMPAYHDANLTDRRNNEEVWVGDNVTILDETDRAYKMRYWSNVANAYKERWVDKAALNESAPVNTNPTPSYQPWQTTVKNRMPAYHDANLTDRRNNEEVWVGDNVTILDETDRAYKMRYWSTAANDYKERWVDKAAINTPAPVNNADKSGWTAYAHYKKQVFTNPELTKTSGYEYVDAKEKVTILEERDNAYKISYWSTAINGYKERWIDKAALTDPIPPTSNDSSGIRQKLDQLHSRNGFRDGDIYKGQGQCRGFANQVYAELFGLSGISGYSDYNYAAGSYPGSYVAGQLRNFGSNDTGAVQQLFSNVQPGAMVQMGRRGRLNSTGTAAAPHTAIVYGVNSNGVEFYEANVSGKNQVNVKFYSWAELAKKNEGFTVYMPENYPSQSTSVAVPTVTSVSEVKNSRIVPNTNWPPINPLITPIEPHTGTTTTEPLKESVTDSARIFDINPGYRNPGYNANGGGLYVYNMNINEKNSTISFDLYNTENATGYIEYYDKDGNFIKAEQVKPHSHVITGISKWFSETGKLTESLLRYGLESPVTDSYNSTKNRITAPTGTSTVIVTNNPTASLYAQVSNAVDKWFDAVSVSSKVTGLIQGIAGLKNDAKTINQILVVPAKEKAIKEIMSEAGKKALQSGLNKLAKAGNQNLLKGIIEGVDIGKIVKNTLTENAGNLALGTTDIVAKQLVSAALKDNPAVLGVSAMFTVGDLINSLERGINEQRLKNVKPMIFQL